jgi:hypothetical protein
MLELVVCWVFSLHRMSKKYPRIFSVSSPTILKIHPSDRIIGLRDFAISFTNQCDVGIKVAMC